MRVALGLTLMLSSLAPVAACGGRGDGAAAGGQARAAGESGAEACVARVPPRPPDGEPRPLPVPRSTIVVDAEVPLARIQQALETKVPRRVAEQRDHDLGRAGRLEYTVDRGPFSLRVEQDTLVVESILSGRAQACAQGRCYAGCAPEARATAKVPMRLHADYKLRTSEVRIELTRGCQVRALGGLLTVDVTPVLRSALAQQTRSVQASIDRELPDLARQAARLWAEMGKVRSLPLGMCVTLSPEAITQGRASGTADALRLRFGLIARPEVRVRCAGAAQGARPGGKPLPPLGDDPALPAAGDLHLAVVLPEEAPSFDVCALGSTLPELARGLSDDELAVAATIEDVRSEGAGWRGPEPIAVGLLRGAVTLRAK